MSRRALLTGGVAVTAGAVGAGVGVAQGVLPGRPRLQARLGLNGEAGVVPDVEPGPVDRAARSSPQRRGWARATGWSIMPAAGRATGRCRSWSRCTAAARTTPR